MPRLTQTRAERAPLPTGESRQRFEWCSEVKGFGVRIANTGGRSWVVQPPNGKRVTLGAITVLPCETTPTQTGARDLAIAALTAERFGKDGKEAVGLTRKPKGLTVNEVWDDYEKAGYPMLRGDGIKAASTIKAEKDRWALYMQPTIGKKPLADIDDGAVRRWADRIEKIGQRSHCVTQLKGLIGYAVSRKIGKPAEAITLKAGKSKEMQNFYSPSELISIDDAAKRLIVKQPHRIGVFSAIRLLLHTGARTSEILSLRWRDIDAARKVISLERHKGDDKRRKDVYLSDEAISIIADLPQIAGTPFVFPAESKSGHLTTLQKAWDDVIEEAGVVRYRRHDLRHSFVSTAIANGVSLYVAGKLVGHQQATTTQRYAHLEHDVGRAALEKVASAVKAKPVRAA